MINFSIFPQLSTKVASLTVLNIDDKWDLFKWWNDTGNVLVHIKKELIKILLLHFPDPELLRWSGLPINTWWPVGTNRIPLTNEVLHIWPRTDHSIPGGEELQPYYHRAVHHDLYRSQTIGPLPHRDESLLSTTTSNQLFSILLEPRMSWSIVCL